MKPTIAAQDFADGPWFVNTWQSVVSGEVSQQGVPNDGLSAKWKYLVSLKDNFLELLHWENGGFQPQSSTTMLQLASPMHLSNDRSNCCKPQSLWGSDDKLLWNHHEVRSLPSNRAPCRRHCTEIYRFRQNPKRNVIITKSNVMFNFRIKMAPNLSTCHAKNGITHIEVCDGRFMPDIGGGNCFMKIMKSPTCSS